MGATIEERSLTSPEEPLARAVTQGIGPNFVRWLRFVGHEEGAPVELQAIDVPGGYVPKARFAHAHSAADAVRLLEEAEKWKAPAVFTIVNDLDPAVATRDVAGSWHDQKKGAATTDRDIRSRAVLFVDVDARRVRSTSATDEEVARTVEVAEFLYKKLAELVGFDALGYGHSGNGRAIFVGLDHIPETPELESTIKGLLATLGKMFEAPRVEIDPVVCDAKRLGPAWGTTKRKGAAGIVERPHRRTGFVCSEEVTRLTMAELRHLLERLRAELTAEQQGDVDRAMGLRVARVERPKTSASPASRERPTGDGPFARANATPIEDVAGWLDLVGDDGPICPGCGAHGNSSVSLVGDGLKCSHASCSQKGAPNRPGFRTPVDLVAEKRGVDAREAVSLLAEKFGFEGFADHSAVKEEAPPFASSAVELGDLAVAPPPLHWLLRDIRTGKPALRAGQVWNVSADGGTGKGYFYLHLAVAVALRRTLFDVFSVEQDGHVALIVAEDDDAELRHRLWRICNALHLDADERKVLKERLHMFSLVGRQAAILRADQYGVLERTALYHDMLDHLGKLATGGGFNWALVGVDPLARFAPSKAEVDNGVATAFVAQLEEMIPRLPGQPSVGGSHHSSKASTRNGKPDSRGVTGLRNAFRATFTLSSVRADDLRGVLLYHDKSNSAPEADPVWLVRLENERLATGWLETSGALALANDEQAERLAAAAGLAKGDPEARRADRDKQRDAAKISKAQARREALLACLPYEPASLATAEFETALEANGIARRHEGVTPELRALCELGLAKDLSDGSRGKPRQWCRVARNGGE